MYYFIFKKGQSIITVNSKSFLLYFLDNKSNMPTSSHTSAPLEAPIFTSNKPSCFLIQVQEPSKSYDFLEWCIILISHFKIFMYLLATFRVLLNISCDKSCVEIFDIQHNEFIGCLSFSERNHLTALRNRVFPLVGFGYFK